MNALLSMAEHPDYKYHVARQPICDSELNIVAYELLYRSCEHATSAQVADCDMATAEVISTALIDAGLETLAENVALFVNITRNLLLGEEILLLPKDRVVIEVLEDIEPDNEVQQAVKRLRAKGYRIALDDFAYAEPMRPIINMAHIVKVDIRAWDQEALQQQVALLEHYPVQLLAEKVETWEEFELCKQLGFQYFQGYFFAKPQSVKGRSLPAHQLAALEILGVLQQAELQVTQLEGLIRGEPFLYYKLMRLINSAQYALRRQVDTVREAVLCLGLNRLRSIVSLLVMLKMADQVPNLLLDTLLARAKMCELLAQRMRWPGQDLYFSLGIFSLLHLCLGIEPEQLIADLPLSATLRNALLHGEGLPGLALRCVDTFQRGHCCNCGDFSDCLRHSVLARECYWQSIQWSHTVRQGCN
jgi:EAL and modified HD-GYP domain-containing signal transduction protein